MIYIFDRTDKQIGVLNNNNDMSTPYYNDVHNNKIAESDEKIFSESLEFEVPYGYESTELLDEGIQLLKEDSTGKYKLFTIYQIEDSIDGITHTKKIYAINSLIWDMNHRYVEGKTWSAANSHNVFSYIFETVGWTLEDFEEFYEGGVKSFSLSSGKRQQALDAATKEFDVEVEAYAHISGGIILDKRVRLVNQMGEKTGQRFEYQHNLKGATRIKSNDELFTKLYVFGGTNSKGERVSITSANKVKVRGTSSDYEYLPYILDDAANDKFNAGQQFLEGVVTNEAIKKPEGLLTWGKKQMDYYNHPHFTYNIDIAILDERPNLGDTIAVVDMEMTPPLTISARVLETNYSDTNPTSDNVVLGEFVTIKANTPLDILNLQYLAQKALSEASLKDWRVELLTPDGLDFDGETQTKRIIAKVYQGAKDVTNLLEKSAFVWQKIKDNKELDVAWNTAHRNVGNFIEVTADDVDNTIRCNVENNLAEISTLMVKERDLKQMTRIKLSTVAAVNKRVHQYAHYDYPRNEIYWSKVTTDTSLVSAADQAKAESYILIRTAKDGTFKDYMIVKWGGHGSHYGFEYRNGKAYILSPMTDVTGGKKTVWSCEFPYQAGKTITIDDASVTKIRQLNVRLNRDVRNNYVLATNGMANKAKFDVYDKTKYYRDTTINALYTVKASDFGVKDYQTYQSACLDFPYLYVSYGIDYEEGCKTYCVDVRTNSLVYQINYEFTHGNINFYHNKAEVETINYYYDANDNKVMLQGFALHDKDINVTQKVNELYSFTEEKRIDNDYTEDLSIDDWSDDE